MRKIQEEWAIIVGMLQGDRSEDILEVKKRIADILCKAQFGG
jgi:hypothetical protein